MLGRRKWDAASIRRLRAALRLSQQSLADALGVRQQTVSEWETGLYQPRGASVRMLDVVAERAETPYGDAEDTHVDAP